MDHLPTRTRSIASLQTGLFTLTNIHQIAELLLVKISTGMLYLGRSNHTNRNHFVLASPGEESDGTRRTTTWSLPASTTAGFRRYGRGLSCHRYAYQSPGCHQGDSLGGFILPGCRGGAGVRQAFPARDEGHCYARSSTHHALI